MPYANKSDMYEAQKRYRERKGEETDAVKATLKERETLEEMKRSLPPILLRGVETDQERERSFDEDYQRRIANDVSISMFDKIVYHSYVPLLRDLKNMTFEQLREVNRGFDAKVLRQAKAAENSELTAGYCDPETKTWHGGKPDVDIDAADNASLTAGKWDSQKKRWVQK